MIAMIAGIHRKLYNVTLYLRLGLFGSDPWMNDFTWSSDDNALVAIFAFPAPLRDESLLAPFDIAIEIEIRIYF